MKIPKKLLMPVFFLFLSMTSLKGQNNFRHQIPEVSGGAQMAFELQLNNIKPIDLPDQKKQTELKNLSNLLQGIEAVDFNQNMNNNGGYFSYPPDPSGAAGPDHLVNVTNQSIQWYNRGGLLQHNGSLQSFFSSVTKTFDPKVIYDQYEGRFVVVTLEFEGLGDMDASNDRSRIYLAVSKTSNPNDGWWFHTINSLTVISGNNTWADYPGFAVDEEAIYITNNMFTFDGPSWSGVRLWIVDKGVIGGFYSGAGASVDILNPFEFDGLELPCQPAHTFGTMPAGVGTYLMSYDGLTQSGDEFVQWVRIDDPLGTPSFTVDYVNLGDIEDTGAILPNAPQMGTSDSIATNGRRLYNAVWRNGKIAMGFTVVGSGSDAGQATAHWVLLNDNNGGSPSLADQGNVGGENIAVGTHTFFLAVALNQNGDLGLGFAASAPSIYPGAYYSARENGDPSGTSQPAKVLRAGLDWYLRKGNSTRNRWGDYTGISVDPSDDKCFWVYNEYAITRGVTVNGQDGRWGTAFGHFCAHDCPANQTLAGTVSSGFYSTSNALTLSGTVSSPSFVNLQSGNEILMGTNAEVGIGAVLSAAIANCPN